MLIHECSSAAELLHKCEGIALRTGSARWFFRGQADASWGLVPSLFRVASGDDARTFEEGVLKGMRHMPPVSEKLSPPDRARCRVTVSS